MHDRAAGFTLVEVLIATSLLTVGLISLAQLALVARNGDHAAALLTVASVLAQDKMEQLRASQWPEATAGCCEFFDAHGRMLGLGPSPPVGTQFVRRWSIDPVDVMPESARVLQVWVEPRGAAAVHLVSVRSRRAG